MDGRKVSFGLDGKPIFDGYIDIQLYKEACGRKCAWRKEEWINGLMKE